jgi:2-polyprenyl-3-methyl-5-hydroxy-6-metoxy-1,4-benzoquinol methylase
MASVWKERLAWIEDRVGKRGSLLDVGAATGQFMNVARDHGWEVQGIELSQWAVEQAQRQFGFSLLEGTLPDSRIPNSAFDIVTMWDCIEHLAHPNTVLREIHRVLRPGGLLVLSTGDVPHLDPKLLSGWYSPPWHLYYFSRETIHQLLDICGFVVDEQLGTPVHQGSVGVMVVAARSLATSP